MKAVLVREVYFKGCTCKGGVCLKAVLVREVYI